jgi:hypothetical protein
VCSTAATQQAVRISSNEHLVKQLLHYNAAWRKMYQGKAKTSFKVLHIVQWLFIEYG